MITNGTIKAVATVRRKTDIRAADPAQHTTQRTGAVAAAAGALSRRNVSTARAEVANEALGRLIHLCYEELEGELVNVDARTGRILVALPWGRLGARHWGLRNSEAVILRGIMLARQNQVRVLPELFHFDEGARAWLCNVRDYSNVDSAMRWFKLHGRVTLGEWIPAEQMWRDGRRGIFKDGAD